MIATQLKRLFHNVVDAATTGVALLLLLLIELVYHIIDALETYGKPHVGSA